MTEHNDDHLRHWFSEDLSDEAAYGITLFLEQFAWRFNEAYYDQIFQHAESLKNRGDDLPPWERSISDKF